MYCMFHDTNKLEIETQCEMLLESINSGGGDIYPFDVDFQLRDRRNTDEYEH